MTLLAPLALWFLPLVGVVTALYLLKTRKRRQLVPALELWAQLASESTTRSLFSRIKRLLSMLLWILIVAALILALSNPIFALGRIKPGSFVVILDTSASMSTQESEAATRHDLALQALERLTSGRPVPDEWLLIDSGTRTRVVQGWTRSPAAIRDAAAGTLARGTNDLCDAVEMARLLLAGKRNPHIVVLSDSQPGIEPPVDDRPESSKAITEVHWSVGETEQNLGIVELAARPHRQRGVHYAYVRIVNAGPDPVESTILIDVNGSTRAAEPFTIDAKGTWERTIELDGSESGVLSVTIDHEDAMVVDNTAYAILSEIRRARVAVVSEDADAYFLERALASMEDLVDAPNSITLAPSQFATFRPSEPIDLTIFNGWAPDQPVAPGSYLTINCWLPRAGVRTIGTLDAPRMKVDDRAHPLMRGVSLRGATLIRAQHIDTGTNSQTLASTQDDHPLIVLSTAPDTSALGFAFDPLESDLPFRNAFPLMLRNAVAHLVAERERTIPARHSIGSPITPTRQLPPDIATAEVRHNGSDGDAKTVNISEGSFTYRETFEPGVLEFELGATQELTAINLTSERESRTAPAAGSDDPDSTLGLSRPLIGSNPWYALAIGATLLVLLEWISYHMRWTV